MKSKSVPSRKGVPHPIPLKIVALVLCPLACAIGSQTQENANDRLRSWNEGSAKKEFVDFVSRVTRVGSADFVPVGAILSLEPAPGKHGSGLSVRRNRRRASYFGVRRPRRHRRFQKDADGSAAQ